MAELLIQAVDTSDKFDVYKDVKLYKRGDVITVQENGWAWGMSEISNPNWIILHFPKTTVDEAQTLLSEEFATEYYPLGSNPMLQIRGFYLDLDAPITTIKDMTRKRLPRKDPNVIG